MSAVRKPRWRIIAANLAHNLVARARLAAGFIDSDVGATHRGLTTQKSVEYINHVFESYLSYGGIPVEALQGKRILEIGPGDNLGVAMRLYAAGAAEVVCVDKFHSRRSPEQQARIFRALRDSLTDAERGRYDVACQGSAEDPVNQECVRYMPGVPAEEIASRFAPESFDIIVSRAVVWEIHDTDGALGAMDSVLKPGGRMIHKIACIDWMFRQEGYHPLEFLTLSAPLYGLLARDSGKSNRKTISYYRNYLQSRGYDCRFDITQLVGRTAAEFAPGLIKLQRGEHYDDEMLRKLAEIRPRLQPEFACLPDEELMVEDMFLIATKHERLPQGSNSQPAPT